MKTNLTPEDERLKEIFKAGHLGKFWEEREQPFRSFGNLIFEGKALGTFIRHSTALHKEKAGKGEALLKTVSEEDLFDAIVRKLEPLYDSKEEVNFAGFWKAIKAELLKAPIRKFQVLREIFGVSLDRRSEALQLGPFRLYNFGAHREMLTNRADKVDFWGEPAPGYLIEVEVQARDTNRAYQLADVKFSRFETMMHFLLGGGRQTEIGILNYRGAKRERAYVFVEGKSGRNTYRAGAVRDFQLDSEFFRHPPAGFARMWDLLGTSGSELEQRLMLALDWVGQSYAERARPTSFLKAAIALETLFTPKLDEIITPSILSSLSESVAMLLADTAEKRTELDRLVKKLYGKRSSIAHEGSDDVDLMELHEIQAISRGVVLKIFENEELNTLRSVKDLSTLIRQNKYAGPPLRAARAPDVQPTRKAAERVPRRQAK
jgi:hypothetical protein